MHPSNLAQFLEETYAQYHHPEYIRLDPLVCLRGFRFDRDREIAGLVAAVLAYGRAEIIIRNVMSIFERTGPEIAAFAVQTSLARKRRVFSGCKHRFTDGAAIALLLHTAGSVLRDYGSLEAAFIQGISSEHPTIKQALVRFVDEFKDRARHLDPGSDMKSVGYLLSSPALGSACKRLNMYLRWMVRERDGIDLGVWKRVPASKLVMPVDTHVARTARFLGLSRRATADWVMADEITARLRAIDQGDPVRFDFSLCRAGMIDFRRKAA